MSEPEARHYLRAVLAPGERRAAERANGHPGVAMVGAHAFLDGVAYVPRGCYLHTTLSRRIPGLLAVLEDADKPGLQQYLRALPGRTAGDSAAPSNPRASECMPGRCSYGPGHACRSIYPDNFPPAVEPTQRVVDL
ncbi:hypothetical protein [Nocardioides donggukensis]|uniref:Uncharacterized protein n=1 Tax=Nocardioides donggukensis TaxID=2774019 RepID=A0A927K398_9ACTN|nr:hypothetical protein [Nocardioides donggukensis]MBD8869299.1 hypothetical protein [Nocardioides donggukensis]